MTQTSDTQRRKFAAGTTTSVAASRDEIERLLTRYGATGVQSGWLRDPPIEALSFQYSGFLFRFVIRLPDPANADAILDRGIRAAQAAHRKHPRTAQDAYDMERARLWRSLLATIKGKLISIDDGIETFEEAFLAQAVTPQNATIGQWLIPQLAAMREQGHTPPLLPGIEQAAITRR